MAKLRNLNREKVIRAACELVESKGVAALTLPTLARQLDIRSRSLYNYVANRSELLDLVGGAMITKMQRQATDHIIGLSGMEALCSLADFIREYVIKHPAIRNIMVSLHDQSEKSALNDAIANFLQLVNKLRAQSQADYFPSPHIYLGAIFGYIFLDQELVGQRQSSEQRWDEYHEMLDSICRLPGYYKKRHPHRPAHDSNS